LLIGGTSASATINQWPFVSDYRNVKNGRGIRNLEGGQVRPSIVSCGLFGRGVLCFELFIFFSPQVFKGREGCLTQPHLYLAFLYFQWLQLMAHGCKT
jgi:hypothetical protein